MSDWRVLSLDGQFTISAPRDARFELEDGGQAFVLHLPTAPATDVRISRHEQRGESLEDVVRFFFRKCVPTATEQDVGASVERCQGAPDVVQGVACDGANGWWLVRAHPVGTDYLWLQWFGPKEALHGTVLEVFQSFTPR